MGELRYLGLLESGATLDDPLGTAPGKTPAAAPAPATPAPADEIGAPLPATPPASAVPAPAAPYLGLLEEGGPSLPPGPEADRTGDFLRWRDANHGLPSDRAAEVLKYGAALGASDPSWVNENLDAIKREVDATQVPWQKLWDEHPGLRPMLGDPVKAAALRDDTKDLPWLQRWLSGGFVAPQADVNEQGQIIRSPGQERFVPGLLQQGLSQGVDSMELAVRRAVDASPWLEPVLGPFVGVHEKWSNTEALAAVARGDLPAGDLTQAEPGALEANRVRIAQIDRQARREIETNGLGRAVLGAVESVPSMVAAGAVGLAAAAAVPAGAAAGTAVAVAGGAKAVFWALQGYGALHEALGEVKGPDGQALSEAQRQYLAGTFSLAGGAAMEFGMRPVARGLGLTADAVMKNAVKTTGEAALRNPGVLKLLGHLGLEWGKATASGAGAMAAQAGLNATALEIGSAWAKGDDDPTHLDVLGISGKAAAAFVEALPTMALMSAVGPLREGMRRRGEIIQAQAESAGLLKAGEGARASKLRDRFSAGYEELVRASVGDEPGARDTVFATTERFDQVAKARGAEPREMAAAIVGDGGAAYDRAKASGEDFEIPVEKYLSQVAPNPELEKQLLPDLRMDRDGRTTREALAAQARDLQVMATVMGEPLSPDDQAAQAVKADFQKMVVATGKFTAEQAAHNAELVARMYAYAAAADAPRAAAVGEQPQDALYFYRNLAPIQIVGWKEAGGAPSPLDPSRPEVAALVARAVGGEPAARRELERMAQAGQAPAEGPPTEGGAAAAGAQAAPGNGVWKQLEANGHQVVDARIPGVVVTVDRAGAEVLKQSEPPEVEVRRPSQPGGPPQAGVDVTPNTPMAPVRLRPEVLEVVRRTIGEEEKAGRISRIRKWVAEQGGEWTVNGVKFVFNRTGISKMSADGKTEALALLPDLKSLLERSVLLKVEDGPREDRSIIESLKYGAWAEVDGRLRRVFIRANDKNPGPPHGRHNQLYSVESIELGEEAPGAFSGASGGPEPARSSPTPGKATVGNLEPTVNVPKGESLKSSGQGGNSDRGAVTITPVEGGPGVKARIDLFYGSDPSTLAHETAHVFSRLLEMLATREGATDAVKADYQAMLQAMGFGSHAEREAARAERLDLQKKVTEAGSPEHQAVQKRLADLASHEERFAYQWEQYLLEGKAPEAALAGPMARMKSWLLKIYGGIKGLADTFRGTYGEDLGPMHPETRALFDRLLTAQDAVKETEAGLRELPGAPPDEAAAWAAAREEAEVRLVRALAEGDRKANSELMKSERERLRGELAPALDAEPGQAAVRVLQQGGSEILRGPAGEPVKLSRKALTKEVGAELTRALVREHPGIFGPKGEGLKADQVAELLGLESGKDLVKLLTDTRSRDAVLEQRVQERMQQLYGAALSQDHGAVAEAALSAAASPKAAAAILKEMRRLAKDIGDPTQDMRSRGVSWARMVSQAEAMVVQGRVADLTPVRYHATMQAAARRAFDAMQAGAKAKTATGRKAAILRAYEARDQQLWALAMARTAEAQKVQLDAHWEQIQKTSRVAWRAELGKADPVFLGAHDAILEAVGAKEPSSDGPANSAALDQAIAKAAADAADLDFDPTVVRQVIEQGRPWRELSVSEAWEVANAVANLRTIANRTNELSILGKRFARGAVLDKMTAAAGKLPAQPKFHDDPMLNAGWIQSVRLGGQHIDALLNDVATVCHMLDGGNRDGIFHQVFIDNRLACREKRFDLTRSFLKELTQAFEKSGLDKGRLREEVLVGSSLPLSPELDRFRQAEVRSRANLIMMVLNLGNASNEERFLGGYGWERQQVLEVASKHLNAKELRWVNDVWAALEGKGDGPSLFEEMARVHQEETGLRPEKIEAKPFKLRSADGELVDMAGGYFPARYDNRPGPEKRTGEKQHMDTVSAFFEGSYQRESLKPFSPHAKARAEHFQDVMSLDWGIVPQHVSQVVQDIAYRTWARQTAAIVLDPRFQNLMAERLGEERAKFFAPWLKAVVNNTSDSIPSDLRLSDRVMGQLRGKAAIASIGWSIPTALGDLSQPLMAVASGEVKGRYLALATAKLANPANYRTLRAFVLANSDEVRMRSERLTARFGDELGAMGGRAAFQNPLLRGVQETAFITMEMTDRLTTTPVWIGRYEQAQAEGFTHAESVKAADAAVRNTFPPEEMATKSRILRSKSLTSFLLFYGFANKVWNVERTGLHDAWSTWHSEEASVGDKAGAIAKAIGRIAAVSLVNGVIGEYFSGRGPDNGESETEWLERKLLAAVFYPIPIVGSLGDWVAGQVTAAANGRRALLAKPSIRNAPALAYMQDTVTRIDKAIEQWRRGDAKAGEAALHAAETLIGVGMGTPLRQVQKTGTAALHQVEGRSPAAGPVEGAGDLMYGESKQDNPMKWLQRRVDGKPLQWK